MWVCVCVCGQLLIGVGLLPAQEEEEAAKVRAVCKAVGNIWLIVYKSYGTHTCIHRHTHTYTLYMCVYNMKHNRTTTLVFLAGQWAGGVA